MIVKTEAIVLSAMKYRDTSKIVRLYTREFGKISVIAKGARNGKSKFRSALEPMSHVSTVIYKTDNRDLQLLSQCDAIESFRHLSEEMEKMYAVMTAIELVNVVSREEETNETLFDLLLNHIRIVNTATNHSVVALYYFEMKLLELLGFKPELSFCVYCEEGMDRKREEKRSYALARDGILCAECSDGSSASDKISLGTLTTLQRLQQANSVESLMNLHFSHLINQEVRRSLRQHLRTHVEGFHGLRSEEVFAAIL
jgi:DNA repair protein RecO (recombination protein O)